MYLKDANTKFHPTFLGLLGHVRPHGPNPTTKIAQDWTCHLRGSLFEALLPLENKTFHLLWRWDDAQDAVFRSPGRVFVCKAGGWAEIRFDVEPVCARVHDGPSTTLRYNPASLAGITWRPVRKEGRGLSSVWCLPYATFNAQPRSSPPDDVDDNWWYGLTAIRHKFMLLGRSIRCPGAFERLGFMTLYELSEEVERDTASFLAAVPLREILIVWHNLSHDSCKI